MECSFSHHSPSIPCSINVNIKPSAQICTLLSCTDNISAHLAQCRINPSSIRCEVDLLKYRAGLFHDNVEQLSVCPNHRYCLGKGWKPSKLCGMKGPMQTCNGLRKTERATITVLQSQEIFDKYGVLIPVGTEEETDQPGHAIISTSDEMVDEHGNLDDNETSYASSELRKRQRLLIDSIDQDQDNSKDSKRRRYLATSNGFVEDVNQDHYSEINSDSQGSLWLPSSQDTGTTDTTDQLDENPVQNNDKRRALDNFLESCGLSPVKKQLRVDWNQSSVRTKQDYSIKARKIFEEVAKVLAPGQEHHLLDTVLKDSLQPCDRTLEILSKAYDLCKDWGTQRQILSIFVSDYSFKEVTSFIPSLTKYRFTAARKHALTKGIGQPLQSSGYHRERLSQQQIEHFIDFVMSPSIMTDSPFLENKLKLSNGEVHQVPQIILNSIRSHVVEKYLMFCAESGVTNVASDRTYMRILEAIEPNVRKSMKGLDNYAAEGAKAFDDLKKVASCLGKNFKGIEWEEDILQRLSKAKQYLKLDFKLHISLESEIPDHCCQYALSLECLDHGVQCLHSHDEGCSSCNDMFLTLEEVKQGLEEMSFHDDDEKDDLQYTFSQSIKSVDEWKKHVLRSVNQDKARADVIENMTQCDVLIERDWAMKFLPMMFREPQSKWFGKRGMNWHVTVGSYLKNGSFHSYTIIHIFDNTNQDALTSNAILQDSIMRLKVKEDMLTKAYIRSDNAGCFHSAEAIFSIPCLNQHSELKVEQMDFADPQGGKSICDRRAAHIKGAIRKYVNEGNDVTTSTEFLNAVKSSNIKNVEIVIASPPKSVVTKKPKFKDITSFNNFKYHPDNVVAFKQYKIGNGVEKPNTTIQVYEKFPEIHAVKSCTTDEHLRIPRLSVIDLPSTAAAEQEPSNNELDNENDSSYLFTCPEPNCIQSFVKYGNLNNHLDKGDHKYSKSQTSLSDRSKVEYIRQIESKNSTVVQTPSNVTHTCSHLGKGWALKSKRCVKRFSINQSSFLKEMFQKGEATGHKYDPEEVSVMMRTIKKDGNRRFTQEEFLTPSQISSYFSRLSLEKRKMAQNNYQDEDLVAEEFENNLIDARITVSNMN